MQLKTILYFHIFLALNVLSNRVNRIIFRPEWMNEKYLIDRCQGVLEEGREANYAQVD